VSLLLYSFFSSFHHDYIHEVVLTARFCCDFVGCVCFFVWLWFWRCKWEERVYVMLPILSCLLISLLFLLQPHSLLLLLIYSVNLFWSLYWLCSNTRLPQHSRHPYLISPFSVERVSLPCYLLRCVFFLHSKVSFCSLLYYYFFPFKRQHLLSCWCVLSCAY